MTTFKATLEHFQNYILKLDAAISEEITVTSRLDIKKQLQIYRNGYYSRLLDVLACDFPMLKCSLGEPIFNQLAQDYIEAHPSENPSILSFGFAFPDFLKNRNAILADQLELAQFELALEKARSISALLPFPVETLKSISPDDWAALQFDLNASARLFESSWGSPLVWKSIAKDLPIPFSNDNPAQKWLIWGEGGAAHFCALDVSLSLFFEAICSGKCFGEVCEILCDEMPEEEVGKFAGRYLNQWIHDQIIVGFRPLK